MNKAILRINPQLMAESLHLPEGTVIEYALGGTDAAGNLQLVVGHSLFPRLGEGAPLPEATCVFRRREDGTIDSQFDLKKRQDHD